MEAANSYFMLYLGFRQGLCKTICPAVESLRTEFSKYFTCFAGSVRSKQEVCGHSEKKNICQVCIKSLRRTVLL